MPTPSDDHEVVKWYTRARRFPQLIAKTPDGATIWGGPYTYTQVGVGVAFIVIGSKTSGLWGHFGTIGNAVVLFASAYGLVLVLGRLPLGSRNPLAVGAGALRAFSAPAQGHLAGAPVRIRRPRAVRSRLVITDAVIAPATRLPAPADSQAAPYRRTRLPRWSRPARPQRPAPPAPAVARLRPTPATTPRPLPPTPALTGVQRLLASAAAPQED